MPYLTYRWKEHPLTTLKNESQATLISCNIQASHEGGQLQANHCLVLSASTSHSLPVVQVTSFVVSKRARQKLLGHTRNGMNGKVFYGTINIQVRWTCGSKYRDYIKDIGFHSALSSRPQRNSLSFLFQRFSSFYL